MRVALVRWRAEQDGELTSFVPDVDLDQLDSWGVIDLRGSGQKYQASADGVALLVAPNHTGPVPGALVDLGDDHRTRLGATVGRALANRLGLNLVEATPGRIAAELLTLHARADDDSKPNPLVGERRFPRSKTDQRRRARVWCAGVLLYDELGAHVDEEMILYTETFPADANPITAAAQDLPWDVNSVSNPVSVESGYAYNRSGAAAGSRMSIEHGGPDHWAEVLAEFEYNFIDVGVAIRLEGAFSNGYGAVVNDAECGIYRIGANAATRTSLAFTYGGIPGWSQQFRLRLTGSGSSLSAAGGVGNLTDFTVGPTTDTTYAGTRAGVWIPTSGDTFEQAFVHSFSTDGEEPGGGGTTVEGEATATLGALTGAATGVATVVGEASSSLGGLSATATGTVQGVVSGQASANLGALTGAATGVRATAGTAASNLGGLTGAADGQPTVVGEAAAQLGGLTGTAAGGKTVVGEAAAHLGGLDGHAVGEGATTVEGEATAALGGLTGTAAGVRTTAGSASSSLGGLTAAGTGQVRVLGAAATVLGGVTAAATGDVIVVATATAALGGLTATGTGTRTVTGAATAALGALTGAVVIVTADPNPLSVTIRETGHRVVVRESRRRIYIG